MSPRPPVEDDLMRNAESLRQGGWIVSVLGAAGSLCRLLLTNEELPVAIWFRRVLAGAIVGILSFFVIHGRIEPLNEAIFYAVCGTAAPELVEFARRKLLNRLEDETKTTKRKRR